MWIPLAVSLCAALPQQAPELDWVERAQRQRTDTVARVAPAVCSVMPVNSSGGGSGVIIDPAGFVLTNFHVVQRGKQRRSSAPEKPAERPTDDRPAAAPAPRYVAPRDENPDDPAWGVMKIGMPDGELYLADVLGIDPGSDLAILLLRPRPDGEPYPSCALGDSDELLVGETVFAMGNPFLLATDFTPTVTWGIVSGTHRYQGGGANRFLVYPDCIQVDAPVNPGNSGGPLFNERGEIVGINGRISVRDRGRVNTGVGFAIASNQIANFLGDMMAGRHAEHGTLDLNAWFMNSPDDQRRGVFVQATFADSRAAQQGVSLGDEITRFNGEEVRSANQLATLVGVLPAGSWVSLAFRPCQSDDSFGAEQEIVFPLTRLDTGSSRDEDRIAGEEHRRLARRALIASMSAADELAAVSCSMGDDSRRIRLSRAGTSLRWDEGEVALIRTAQGGFAIEGGEVRDLSAEEAARMERVASCAPFLYGGAERLALASDSVLEGGVHVFGEPAYRFRLAGDGQREVFLFPDGGPAGCRYRDPVYRHVVEFRLDRAGERVRCFADGELAGEWPVEVSPSAATDLFERPGR